MGPYLQVMFFFLGALCFRNSRTYQILLAASVVNLIVYLNTSESTILLAYTYSLIDTITAVLIFEFADRAKWFQISLLSCAAVINYLMQIDVNTGSSIVFDNYVVIVTGITALQMIGAVIDGLYNGFSDIRRNHTDRAEHHYFSHAHRERD